MKSDAMSVPEQPPVPREKRPLNPWLLVFGAGFGFVVLVVVGLLSLAQFAPKQTLRANEVQMPDGKVLRIEGLTWGKTHRLDFERSSSGFWEFLYRGRMPIQRGSGQDQLTVWMTCHDAKSGRSLDFDWWAGSVAIDSHGDEIPDHDAFHWQMGPHGNSSGGIGRPFRADRGAYDTWIVSSSLPAFRTDQGRFKLQVKNLASEVVATFELTHPSPPAAQTWPAEELPATKSNGDLAVALQRLNANFHWATSNGEKLKYWYYSPETVVSENGQPTTDWSASLLDVTDSLGNQNYNMRSLSIREPTWKVRLAACRVQTSKFAVAETWSFAEMPLPEKDTALPRSDTQSISGVTVTLVALAGPGKTSYSIATPGLSRYGNFSSSSGGTAFDSSTKVESKRNGSTSTSSVEANWPHLTLESTGLSPLHRLYLLAKDDQGRDVPTQQTYHYGELQSFFFKTEPDAKSLMLTIIVHKGHEFEFFIQPPELPEDKPMP